MGRVANIVSAIWVTYMGTYIAARWHERTATNERTYATDEHHQDTHKLVRVPDAANPVDNREKVRS